MIASALLLSIALLSTAPGQIYRCAAADGSVGYQDQPCDGKQGTGFVAQGDSADGSELRQWLQKFPKQHGSSTAGAPAITARSRPPADYSVVSERQLAICSERFLACASGNAQGMDRCIAALPRCSASRSTECCPSSCISSYQTLRQSGNGLSAAVHDALLAPDRPSCAPPGEPVE